VDSDESSSNECWSVRDGVLINRPVQEEGKPTALRTCATEREFEISVSRWKLACPRREQRIYLRGIYEIQSRKVSARRSIPTTWAQSTAASAHHGRREAGRQWQTFDITLVDRHVTVVLNGSRSSITASAGMHRRALWSDEFRPAIYLQATIRAWTTGMWYTAGRE